jgi:chitinase
MGPVPVLVSAAVAAAVAAAAAATPTATSAGAAVLAALRARGEAVTTPQPVRAVYIDWRDVDWVHPNATVVSAVDAGFNVVILAFWLSTSGAADMALAWAGLDAPTQAATAAYAHARGAVLLVSAGGSSDLPYPHMNGTAFGAGAGAFAAAHSLDGVDIDAENLAPGFAYPPLTGADMVTWLVDASVAVKRVMGAGAIVTHAPQAPYFGPVGGDGWTGPTGGYSGVWARAGGAIDFFNLQFYNQGGCYTTYSSMFVQSAPGGGGGGTCGFPGTAVSEIASYGVPLAAMVVGKPLTPADAGSGYVTPAALRSYVVEAAGPPVAWETGVMAWSWDAAQAPAWIATVWPPGNNGSAAAGPRGALPRG